MAQHNRILDEAPVVEITVDDARDASPDELYEKIGDALDEAQAPVFASEQPYNYVVIKIVKQ